MSTISIKQGDSEVLFFTITNLSDLNNPLVSHPLYPQGLQTPGYKFRFVAKRNDKSDQKSDILKEDSSGVGGIFILGTTQGYIQIKKEDTKKITIPGKSVKMTCEMDMSNETTGDTYTIIDAVDIEIRKENVRND